MEIKEQAEADLRALSSSLLSASVKRAIDKTIFKLRTQSKIEIVTVDDPFVILFTEISKDKRLVTELSSILSLVRTLTEIGAIDGQALKRVLEILSSLSVGASENVLLKILQISLSAFMSPSQEYEQRVLAARLVFQMTRSTSEMVKHVATATAYQIVDALFDQIVPKSKASASALAGGGDLERRVETLVGKNDSGTQPQSENKDSCDCDQVDENHWAVVFVFKLINDILCAMSGLEVNTFRGCFEMSDFPEAILRYVLDGHFNDLQRYKTGFQTFVDNLAVYVQKQGDSKKFAMFAPHIVANLIGKDKEKAKDMINRLIELADRDSGILNSIAAIITFMPMVQFTLISEEMLLKLANRVGRFFMENFKGVLSEPVVIKDNNVALHRGSGYAKSGDTCKLVSCVVILYSEMLACGEHLEYFLKLFNIFEGVWQRVIQTTEDSVTLDSSLKVAGMCVECAVAVGQRDPSQRIFSTICGLAIPTTAAFPLAPKGVIALDAMIGLLQKLNSKLILFWPLIFETISKCHHTAAHKRSKADLQALKLIEPSLVTFSTDLDDSQYQRLFEVILNLSQREVKEFIERKGTVPNFWLIRTLCYIFVLNLRRSTPVEKKFFEHVKTLIQGESPDFRSQMTVSLFDVAKEVVNSQEASPTCRQAVFDGIFQAANSLHREVTVIAFGSILSFLAGGTAQDVREGWPMILTVLKVVWATPFPENIPNGFRALTFVCNDCLAFLSISDMEVCLSAISTYISQVEDMNISLGSMGLLWNLGSYIAGMSDNEDSSVWKILFKTLQNNFTEKRRNIRDSALQTFFSLVNTFHSQFTPTLKSYVLTDVLNPLVDILPSMDSSILAIQGVMQCLRSLQDYQGTIDKVVNAIEALSKRTEESMQAGEATRCYIGLFMFNDTELSRKVTSAFLRTIELYTSRPAECDLQGPVSVVTEVFPRTCGTMTDEEFELWLKIIKLFCCFQLDKPYLHVATHACLNCLAGLPKLPTARLLLIIELLISFIDLSCHILSAKAFNVIAELYTKSFDEEGRAHSLELLLPLFQRMIACKECFECFQAVLSVDVSLEILFKSESSVFILIDLARRNQKLKGLIVTRISSRMDLLDSKAFKVFLSLGKGYPELYLRYFEDFCKIDSEHRDFVVRTMDIVKEAIEKDCKSIIDEENALQSILQKQRYEGMMVFLESMSKLETDGSLFDSNGTDAHIKFILSSILQLGSTRCSGLRTIVQSLLCQLATERCQNCM